MTVNDAIETYLNGNISDFKKWLKKASKIDILDAIEVATGQYGIPRHQIITTIQNFLVE